MGAWLLVRYKAHGYKIGAAGYRRDDGRIGCLPGEKGHVFFGPYLALPDGRYRITLRVEKNGIAGRRFSAGMVEAVVNGTIIASARLGRAAWRSGVVALDFEVRRPDEAAGSSILEIRLHSSGGLALIIASVELELREAYGLARWPRLPSVSGRAGAANSGAGPVEGRPPAEPPAAACTTDQSAMKVGVTAKCDRPGASAGAFKARIAAPEPDADPNESSTETCGMGFATLPEFAGGSRPLSRIAAWEDWDDTAWSQFRPAAPPEGAAESGERDVGEWERTHLLYGLNRCGKLTVFARVLVAATMPDEVTALLSENVGRVEVLDLTRASDRRGPEGRLYWSNGGLYARDRLAVHEPALGLDRLDEAAYDVIAFPHGSLFFSGIAGIARLMAKAERLLVAGGVLAFKADILAGSEPDVDHLDTSIIGEDGLTAKIEAETGFVLEEGFDPRISARIAASMLPDIRANLRAGSLVREHRGRLAVPSLWFLRKRGQTPEGGWSRIEEWLLQRILGNQIYRLQLGPAGNRDGAGRIVTKDLVKGRVFFGPYLGLPSGRYEAVVSIETPATARRGHLILDVVTGGKRLQYENVKLGRGGDLTVRLPFTVASPSENGIDKIEIRAWRKSGEATFTACRVNRET